MNCSGKHAAMLATCVVNGWDTSTYLSVDHPLQVAIRETFADLTGEAVEMVAVDGCGAPLLSTSLPGLARAFRALSIAEDGHEARVAEAIRQHPEYVSGTRRDELRLLTAIPGAIGKAGAESCYAVGLPDGRAVALKTTTGRRAYGRCSCRRRSAGSACSTSRAWTREVVTPTERSLSSEAGEPVGWIRAAF